MLDKDNIISTSISEAVEKIPTDEKDYLKCCFMCLLWTATAYKVQTNSRNSSLPTRTHPVYLKKLLKIFYIKATQKKV